MKRNFRISYEILKSANNIKNFKTHGKLPATYGIRRAPVPVNVLVNVLS